jgi:hypothetical protein
MIDASAYPHPVPLSQTSAVDLVTRLGQWPDVPGTFISYVMIAVEERIGEWRFAGASRSLAAAFGRLGEFAEALGVEIGLTGRAAMAQTLASTALEYPASLEEGYSSIPYIAGLTAPRVVLFCQGGAPYDDFGLCILEVEPKDSKAFFARAPETEFPETWIEYAQQHQQEEAEEEEDEE